MEKGWPHSFSIQCHPLKLKEKLWKVKWKRKVKQQQTKKRDKNKSYGRRLTWSFSVIKSEKVSLKVEYNKLWKVKRQKVNQNSDENLESSKQIRKIIKEGCFRIQCHPLKLKVKILNLNVKWRQSKSYGRRLTSFFQWSVSPADIKRKHYEKQNEKEKSNKK